MLIKEYHYTPATLGVLFSVLNWVFTLSLLPAGPFVDALKAGSYDIVFADPPYTSRLADRVLAAWQASRFSAILVIEHAPAHRLPPGADRLAFADTLVTIYRAGAAGQVPRG